MSNTILCLSSAIAGKPFIEQAHRQNCRVIYIMEEKVQKKLTDDHATLPRNLPDELYFLPDMYNREHLINSICYLARTRKIDRIVAIDDFDVEYAAAVREHMRMPGMGESTARHFRDKLAMRGKAQSEGIRVPAFSAVINHDALRDFMARVPAPWILKPRLEAAAFGMQKVYEAEALWPILEALGDKASFYVLEQFVAGDVFHADSIVWDGEVLFTEVHKYLRPPFDLTYEGGIASSGTILRNSEDWKTVQAMNDDMLIKLGLQAGVTHSEFIKAHEDGQIYFLETSCRVGGGQIDRIVLAATGVDLWEEWAKLEIAQIRGEAYSLPEHRTDYAASLLSLARQEHPDLSAYNDAEVAEIFDVKYHAGLILASAEHDRVQTLLDSYMRRYATDFAAVLPPRKSIR